MAEPVKISKPSKEQERALSLKGADWRLVWEPQTRDWKTVKVGEVKTADITYDDWKKGKTTYTPITPGRGGALDVTEETTARETALDPLYKYVRDYGLSVVTDLERGTTSLKGIPKGGQTPVPFYLYLDSKGTINLSEDYEAIKKKAIDDLKVTGKLDALFQELYNKKQISKATYNSRNIQSSDFNAALVNAINTYSKGVVGNRQFDPTATQVPDFLEFLQSGAGLRGPEGGGDENLPRREFQDISKIELNKFIDSIYLETIGRKPSEDQRKAKLKELDSIVKKGIVTTTSVVGGEVQTRRKGGFDEQQQALRLQKQLKEENPLEYERRQAFDFMDELQKIMSGGM